MTALLLCFLRMSAVAHADDAETTPVQPATAPSAEPPPVDARPEASLPVAEVKVRAKMRVADFPAGAPDGKCVVRITIDEEGVPFSAEPTACPEALKEGARKVALRFRFYPVEENGAFVKARFDLTIHHHP